MFLQTREDYMESPGYSNMEDGPYILSTMYLKGNNYQNSIDRDHLFLLVDNFFDHKIGEGPGLQTYTKSIA